MVKSCDRCKWRACAGASRTCSIERSADQLSELSIMSGYLPTVSLLAYKICSRNQKFSSLLGFKQPSFKFADRVSPSLVPRPQTCSKGLGTRLSQPWQLQDRDNEGRGFIRRSNLDAGYLSCLENPTDTRSVVYDAKEVLAIAIKRLPGICTYRSIQV